MNARIRFALLVTAIVMGPMLVSAGSDESALLSTIGEQVFLECGLDKLDQLEQDRLLNLVVRTSGTSFLEVSAARFMENEGWEPVSVLGLIKSGDTGMHDYRVLAQHHGVMYSLRPSIIPHLPDPGVYWADRMGSHWELLFPDGEDGSFFADTIE